MEIEYYRKLYTFANQMSVSIFNAPYYLGGINLAFYGVISKSDYTNDYTKCLLLLLLLAINITISIGLWRHIQLQSFFTKEFAKIQDAHPNLKAIPPPEMPIIGMATKAYKLLAVTVVIVNVIAIVIICYSSIKNCTCRCCLS